MNENSGRTISLVTSNREMKQLLAELDRFTATEIPVLLIGETGVGKELFAEYIHLSSHRSGRPFVRLSLSSLPESLLASELFGHEKGSFTSASTEKKGLFEIASGGTLFLDDIDDVPMEIQTKLLRVLESGEIFRVGGIRPIAVDVRLISATKVDLKQLASEGKFRSDLYYRILGYPVKIPPLRDRLDDIPLLVRHFIRHYAPSKPVTVHPEAMKAMELHTWPGNIRELRHVVQRLVYLAEEEILFQHLPEDIRLTADKPGSQSDLCLNCLIEERMNHEDIMACLEKKLIEFAVKESGGNKTQAAKRLGLSPSTFRDKLTRYGLSEPDHATG